MLLPKENYTLSLVLITVSLVGRKNILFCFKIELVKIGILANVDLKFQFYRLDGYGDFIISAIVYCM